MFHSGYELGVIPRSYERGYEALVRWWMINAVDSGSVGQRTARPTNPVVTERAPEWAQ